jgi:hypothetical protein
MRPRTQLAKFVWSGPALSEVEWGPRPLNACGKVPSAGNSYSRPLLALAVLTALAPCAKAQTSNAAAPARPTSHFNLPAGSRAFARNRHPASRSHRSSPLTSLLLPFFGDSFNPDDFTGDPAAPQVPPFLLQATRALSGPAGLEGQPDNTREPSSSQPLLIELQGGRYVRVSSAAIDGEAVPLSLAPGNIHPNNAQPSKSTRTQFANARTQNPAATSTPLITAASPARDLPAAVLIFRDGHNEEVHDYTIADGFLYARGDYYTDGYWNKKIDLSTLDLAQTLQANSTRNVKFILPSSPNEVITRP